MTVTTTANSISYAGNGTTTAFAFPYVFFAATDLVVTLNVTATNAAVTPPPVLNGGGTYDYSVTGAVTHGEYASGGTVTFNTAPITGWTVSFVRVVPAIQTVTLIDNTKFPADTINTEFDYLTVLAGQSVAGGGGGGTPSGPAGGDLLGSYPNPTIKPGVALTGNPTAPTPAASDNDSSIATTAWVQKESKAGSFMAQGGSFTNDATGHLVPFATILTGNEDASWNTTTSQYKPPAGRYMVTACVGDQGPNGSNGTWTLFIRKNGSINLASPFASASSLFSTTLTVTAVVDMNGTTDFIEIWAVGTAGMNAQGGTIACMRVSA